MNNPMQDDISAGREWHDRLQDEGTWQRVKGKIRAEWGDLTDQEVEQARGNFEQFAGRIIETTGETAERIQDKLSEWAS
ncbi:MAG: CsbD family protein [Acidimicrobiia bacterium]